MREEMQLVQDMEIAEDRDSEAYVDKLEQILAIKTDAIMALRSELKDFQSLRAAIASTSNAQDVSPRGPGGSAAAAAAVGGAVGGAAKGSGLPVSRPRLAKK